jgi:hypothetical protein
MAAYLSQTTTSTMEQREMRRVSQKGSTVEALTHRKWRTNQLVMSNVKGNLALSLSGTQARRLIRSREQLTSYHPM